MTNKQARQIFDAEIKPHCDGFVAVRCAWVDFVDSLARDNQITDKQARTWGGYYSNSDKRSGNKGQK